MKKALFLFAIFSMFTFQSCKENAADKVKEENVEVATSQAEKATQTTPGKYPVMTFDSRTHDFGKIPQGTRVEHLFTFTNTGEAPLILNDAKGSCGCTVPSFTKEPIAPGEKGEMLVKFDGTGQNARTISVNVSTNTKSGSERVTIKAFVEPKEGANAANNLSPKTSKK